MNNSILSNLIQNASGSGRPSISERLATTFGKIKGKFNFEDIIKFMAEKSTDTKIKNTNVTDSVANSFAEQGSKSNQILQNILLFMTKVEKEEMEHRADMFRLKSEETSIRDKRHKEILDIFNRESTGNKKSSSSFNEEKSYFKKSNRLKKSMSKIKTEGLLGKIINAAAFGTGVAVGTTGGTATPTTPSKTPGGTTGTTGGSTTGNTGPGWEYVTPGGSGNPKNPTDKPTPPAGSGNPTNPTDKPTAEKVVSKPNKPKESTREEGLKGIAQKESGNNYNRLVTPLNDKAPSELNDLTNLSLKEILKLQKEMIKSGAYPSSAVGKYQIINSTLLASIESLKLDIDKTKFNAETQDKIFTEYLTKSKREDVGRYLAKDSPTKEDEDYAILALAKEFASVPVPKDIFRPYDGNLPARNLKAGESYYENGPGGVNHAGFKIEEIRQMLREEKKLREDSKKQEQSRKLIPKENDKVSQIPDMLIEDNINSSPKFVVFNNTTNNIQTKKTTMTSSVASVNPYLLGKMA
jgi:hypothetical protein